MAVVSPRPTRVMGAGHRLRAGRRTPGSTLFKPAHRARASTGTVVNIHPFPYLPLHNAFPSYDIIKCLQYIDFSWLTIYGREGELIFSYLAFDYSFLKIFSIDALKSY